MCVAPAAHQSEACPAGQALTKAIRHLAVLGLEEAAGVDQGAVAVALHAPVGEQLVVDSAALHWCEDPTPALGAQHEAVLALPANVVDAGSCPAPEAVLGQGADEQEGEDG